MISVWPQWWQTVGGPLDKIWVAFVWPIRSRMITTSSPLVRCWISSVAPMLASRGRYLCHVQLHPTWFEPILNVGVDQWLHICIVPVGLYPDGGSLLLVGLLFHSLQCHNCPSKLTEKSGLETWSILSPNLRNRHHMAHPWWSLWVGNVIYVLRS